MDEALKKEEERIKKHFQDVKSRPVAHAKPKLQQQEPAQQQPKLKPRPQQPRTTAFSSIGASSNRCAVCGKAAYPTESVQAGKGGSGATYHTSCFRCSVCRLALNLSTFRAVGSSLFCQRHATEAMAKEAESRPQRGPTELDTGGAPQAATSTCSVCKQGVASGQTFFTIGDRQIHESCFRCSSCGATLDAYFEGSGGNLVCPGCFYREEKLSGTCEKCGKAVGDKDDSVAAIGKVWHRSCLTCGSCGKAISKQCIDHDGKPFCSTACVDTASGTKCHKCSKPISDGQHLQVGERHFHSGCFTCKCGAALAGVDFYEVGGEFLCHSCATS